MLCKGCGRSVAEDAQTCAYCGRELLEVPEELVIPEKTKTPEPEVRKGLDRRLLWVMPVLLVMILGIAALLFFGKTPAPKTKTVYLQTETIEHSYNGTPMETTTLEYDSQGRLMQVTKPSRYAAAHLTPTCTITYEYDGDRLTAAHIADGSVVYDLIYSYKDGVLELAQSEEDPKTGAYIRAKCDKKGRITRLYHYSYQFVYKKYAYTYHEDGQVASCTIENPMTSDYSMIYHYDTRGNLTEYTIELQGDVSQRVTYTYDEEDRLTLKQEYSSDADVPASSLKLNYETNDAGMLTAIHIFQTNDGETVSLSVQGEPQGNTVELKKVSGPETVPEDLCITVGWDDAGNVLEEKVFMDGVYAHYITYEYTPMELPADYLEPASCDPMWLMDI